MEEWARNGVETVFVRAPASATPEDRLAIQVQSMLAEYERAQMLERSRRGKRHRAQRGEVSILGGAPYGYRYWKKTADSDAWYEVVEPQASVVREVFAYYTVDHLSIGAIARTLNERGVRTASGRGRWERSTVWGMLRNPAYKGRACFGKTRVAPRQRITRPLRRSDGVASRDCAGHERPREEWIEIPVPAIIPEATFALAEERLARNQKLSARKTRTPSVAQGIASCGKCGYAMSRTSAQTSARKISYYRCLGSDAWRHMNGPLCDNRPVRQDLLDDVVWNEILRLLENPSLIQSEIDRRMEAAQNADPNRQREQKLSQSLVRTHKGIQRLVNAYQKELITLEVLRQRLPELRSRESALNRELQSVKDHVQERETYLRLTETLEQFLEMMRHSAKVMDIPERQRIARLLVKEVLVADDTITIRHSIPIPQGPPQSPAKSSGSGANTDHDIGYLLCTRSLRTANASDFAASVAPPAPPSTSTERNPNAPIAKSMSGRSGAPPLGRKRKRPFAVARNPPHREPLGGRPARIGEQRGQRRRHLAAARGVAVAALAPAVREHQPREHRIAREVRAQHRARHFAVDRELAVAPIEARHRAPAHNEAKPVSAVPRVRRRNTTAQPAFPQETCDHTCHDG